jgi:8-oxo-dGTP pyrophosphatase MutT (NUDIX family)
MARCKARQIPDMHSKRSTLPEISEKTKATWARIRHDRSAGGVAYRRVAAADPSDPGETGGERIEVALIATRGGQRWQLPKGSRELDETSLQTAIREVHEEVGLHTEDEGFLQAIDYWYWDTYRKEVPELVHKEVEFHLLAVVGGELSDSSYEVDAVGWFTLEGALVALTFDGERAVLELAQTRLKSDATPDHQ